MEIKIGCAGWSYQDWKGPFYPKSLDSTNYLTYYSKFFNFVEINTSFYAIPPENSQQQWINTTPSDFQFSLKMWKDITHKLHESELFEKLRMFLNHTRIIQEKCNSILFQFPPNLKHNEKNEQKISKLIQITNEFSSNLKCAIEFRNRSWNETLDEQKFSFLSENNYIISSYLSEPPELVLNKSPHLYIRMIGDRNLTKFGKKQRDQIEMMSHLLSYLKNEMENPTITDLIVIFNNHFRGFSPYDANELKKELNLPYREFSTQKTILDFVIKKKDPIIKY